MITWVGGFSFGVGYTTTGESLTGQTGTFILNGGKVEVEVPGFSTTEFTPTSATISVGAVPEPANFTLMVGMISLLGVTGCWRSRSPKS